jgi:[protein-PII] uridylyltransferase
MHALGVLELLIPEFHGIDALVIRDAYHRYTVDEHTFVLIDTLHGLESALKGAAEKSAKGEWAARFGGCCGAAASRALYRRRYCMTRGRGEDGEHRVRVRGWHRVMERLELDAVERAGGNLIEPSGDVSACGETSSTRRR